MRREIAALRWIVDQVEQHVGVGRAMNELPRTAPYHQHRRDGALGEIFADDPVGSLAAIEPRRQTMAVDCRPERGAVAAREIDQRRQDVDERDARADAPR